MTDRTTAAITYLAVSPEVWSNFPEDRPLAHLTNDAAGMARRVRKGADAFGEMARLQTRRMRLFAVASQILLAGTFAIRLDFEGADAEKALRRMSDMSAAGICPEELGFVLPSDAHRAVAAWYTTPQGQTELDSVCRKVGFFYRRAGAGGFPVLVTFHE